MLDNPIITHIGTIEGKPFDYTLAVEVAKRMPELEELKFKQKLINDIIALRGEKMKYREMYRLLEDQYKLTKKLFYIQTGVSIAVILVLVAIGGN